MGETVDLQPSSWRRLEVRTATGVARIRNAGDGLREGHKGRNKKETKS